MASLAPSPAESLRNATRQLASPALTTPSSSSTLRRGSPTSLSTGSRSGGLRLRCEATSSPVLERTSVEKKPEKPELGDHGEGATHSREQPKKFKVLVAGAGIGGLVFALGAKNRGIDVEVFERDLTAIRGEGQYRGPIQVQSNALAALEAVDVAVAEEVMAAGCITGDRINGLCDGVTGEWYVKFDTFTPAAESGLPVTRVISRMTLQQILVRAVGEGIIRNGVSVTDFQDDGSKVKVELSNGEIVEGDILVGADGIRSKVREILLGTSTPTYSDYTCYTGICDFVPADIDTVGYRVFLGHRQYFVSSDVGHGKMQWYAFHNEPAGGADPAECKKETLLKLFGNWCDDVVELISATPESDVLRRDIYDRIPILQWGRGRVTLLGDSAHAMQPNLGQGGCMAIEDGYQLALDLDKAMQKVQGDTSKLSVDRILQQYESERRVRVGTIHGMARMAAMMASTYRAYLGEGLGPLEWLAKFHIPHWGRVIGQVVMKLTMPLTLKWVLGGNQMALEGRAPSCRLEDKASSDLKRWMTDNDALERASQAEWFLLPSGDRMPSSGNTTDAGHEIVFVGHNESHWTVLGSAGSATHAPAGSTPVVVSTPGVEAEHCLIDFHEDHSVWATDISSAGTWLVKVNGNRERLPQGIPSRIHSGEALQLGPEDKVGYRLRTRKAAQAAVESSPVTA